MFNIECTHMFLCKLYDKSGWWILSTESVKDCYYRDEKVYQEYTAEEPLNPDDCEVKKDMLI